MNPLVGQVGHVVVPKRKMEKRRHGARELDEVGDGMGNRQQAIGNRSGLGGLSGQARTNTDGHGRGWTDTDGQGLAGKENSDNHGIHGSGNYGIVGNRVRLWNYPDRECFWHRLVQQQFVLQGHWDPDMMELTVTKFRVNGNRVLEAVWRWTEESAISRVNRMVNSGVWVEGKWKKKQKKQVVTTEDTEHTEVDGNNSGMEGVCDERD